MSFGFQSFINGTGFDVINSVDISYTLDVMSITGRGSKTYTVPTGYKLEASVYSQSARISISNSNVDITINGNQIAWSIGSQAAVGMIVTLRLI